MPRIQRTETTVYTFDELSEEAKETAVANRQRLLSEGWDSHDSDRITEWLESDGEASFGIEFDYRRKSEPEISWTTYPAACSFAGRVTREGLAKAIQSLPADGTTADCHKSAVRLAKLLDWCNRIGADVSIRAVQGGRRNIVQECEVDIGNVLDFAYDIPSEYVTPAVDELAKLFPNDATFADLAAAVILTDDDGAETLDAVALQVLADWCEERGANVDAVRWFALCATDEPAAEKVLREVEEAAEEFVSDVAHELARMAEAEYDYQTSEERAREDCEDGDDEYTEDGELV